MSAAELVGLDERNLKLRREYLRLGPDDQEVMIAHIPWIEANAPTLAHKFYDQQLAFEPTYRFLSQSAERASLSLQALRSHLEERQTDYLVTLFTGARTGWDINYFTGRMNIGILHNEINLPMKWYLGAYTIWRSLICDALRVHHKNDLNRIDKAMRSIEKVINLDTQAVVDTFLISALDTMGLGVDAISPEGARDRTEYFADLKANLDVLAGQAEALMRDEFDNPILQETISGKIGSAFTNMVGRARAVGGAIGEVSGNISSVAFAADQLSESAREISAKSSEVARLSTEAAQVADQATMAMTQLRESSNKIDRVVSTIASVAEKTKLLALNATIEAARAGEAGKGFSVVASEVKTLANQTGDATIDIEAQIRETRDQITHTVTAIEAIVERIKAVNASQITMAGAVEEQSIAVNELGGNLAAASSAANRIRDEVGVRS